MSFAHLIERNARFYRDTLRTHGPTAPGVDFNSPEAMHARFVQLLKIRDVEGPFSLNDYGCGYGALCDWMAARGLRVDYRGFDVCEAMVIEAQRLHADVPNTVFVQQEAALAEADYTVASGIFNRRFADSDDEWLTYFRDTLLRMAAVSRRGIAFNALTRYSDADRMRPELYYADPGQLFDFCKRAISRHVALLHDYGLYDFTILVRKIV